MKLFFLDMLAYTFHFNESVLKQLNTFQDGEGPQKSMLLINHTINAQQIWNARVAGTTCVTGVWQVRPIEDLLPLNHQNYLDSVTLLEEHSFDERIVYKNSKGMVFENTVKDILFHMVNHSTYHRGQIAANFKAHGITPLITDYIFYKRDAL